jgi:hypothetical protein
VICIGPQRAGTSGVHLRLVSAVKIGGMMHRKN